jgi:hypothetical protein
LRRRWGHNPLLDADTRAQCERNRNAYALVHGNADAVIHRDTDAIGHGDADAVI